MSRPLTEEENRQLRAALDALNKALEAFSRAGYKEVELNLLDITAIGDIGKRMMVTLKAIRDVDVLRL